MKKHCLLLAAALLTAALAGCAPKPAPAPTPERSPAPGYLSGRWELVDADFENVADDAYLYAPGGGLAARSREDSPGSSSLVLLDTATGAESVLLAGADGTYYYPYGWLDDGALLCQRVVYGGDTPETEFLVCDLEGAASPAALEGENPFLFAQRGRLLAYLPEPQGRTLVLVRIEDGGGVAEVARTELEGYPINGGGVSADGALVAFPMRGSFEDEARSVYLWNTASGQLAKLVDPTPEVGRSPAAITVRWTGDFPEVDYNISDAPDANGHNELWRYCY